MQTKARELHEQGKSLRDIAVELKTSKSTVARMLEAMPEVKTKGLMNPRWTEVGGTKSRSADAWGVLPEPDVATLLRLNEDSIYACTTWCANAVAKSDLKVLVTTHPGQINPKCLTSPIICKSLKLQQISKAAKIQRVVNHPLVDLLEHPCDEMSKYDFLYYLDTQLSLAGEAFVHIVREDYEIRDDGTPIVNEGLPVGLWPLLTQHVTIYSENGRVAGYTYSINKEPITYKKCDVIHFKMVNHENPYGPGYGPVRAVYERILLGKYELGYLNSLFRNQARFDSLVVLKGGASNDQCERYQKELEMRFSKGGMGGPWVVEEDDVDVKPLSWSPKDILSTELYKWTKLQIINSFGLNAAIFDTESSNRATATTARIQSQENCVEPRLRLIEEKLNQMLCKEFDERLLVEFESPVEVDSDAEVEKNTKYLAAGVYTVDEVRAQMGLPAKPTTGG
jgi:HK97 family phage portal protein